MKVLGIGNSLVDILIKVNDKDFKKTNIAKGSMNLIDDKKLEEAENIISHYNKEMAAGGSAANTIDGLSRLGIDTGFIGKVGKDQYGDFFINYMRNAKINTFISKGNQKTGRAIVFITPDSERTFLTFLGSSIELSSEDLQEDIFKHYDILHIEGYLIYNHGLIDKAMEFAKKHNLKISLDLASFNVVRDNLNYIKSIVQKGINFLFANEEEAREFTGIKDPEKSTFDIAKNVEYSIVKIGKKGSLVVYKDKLHRIEPYPVNAIDTTGAGDMYASGFLYGIIKNLEIDNAGMIGSLTSSEVVKVIGAKLSKSTWEDIKNKIAGP